MRWTIRGVDIDTVEMIREVAFTSDMTLGACLDEAVRFWYESLPDSPDDAETEASNSELDAQQRVPIISQIF